MDRMNLLRKFYVPDPRLKYLQVIGLDNFTNKTSHVVASWYQPPGGNLAELTSEIDLLRIQLQKIKCVHKGNKPPQPMSWGTSTSEALFGQIDLTNQVHL